MWLGCRRLVQFEPGSIKLVDKPQTDAMQAPGRRSGVAFLQVEKERDKSAAMNRGMTPRRSGVRRKGDDEKSAKVLRQSRLHARNKGKFCSFPAARLSSPPPQRSVTQVRIFHIYNIFAAIYSSFASPVARLLASILDDLFDRTENFKCLL